MLLKSLDSKTNLL